MPDSTIDEELAAIKTITEALEPLDSESRQRALAYAMQRLGIERTGSSAVDLGGGATAQDATGGEVQAPPAEAAAPHRVVDIRTLKEEKRPNTDVEMVTLVAYYLKQLAEEDERKDEIGTEELEKYFVQAGYPLPKEKRFALTNAKNAGYLESLGRGRYKLNSVGHNLVAHGMPRAESAGSARTRRQTGSGQKASKKKATKKKASSKKLAKKKGRSTATR